MVDAALLGVSFYGGSDNVGGYVKRQISPVLPDPPENLAFAHS
jgi:hypothetical protein